MKELVLHIVLVLTWLSVQAQNIDFAGIVSYDYSGETLEEVLEDLSERYKIKFSYSRQVLPLNMTFHIGVTDEIFAVALEKLFENTPVIYGFIGDQIVLSVDPLKMDLLISAPPESVPFSDNSLVSMEPRGVIPQPARIEENAWAFAPAPTNHDLYLWSRQDILDDQKRLMDRAEKQAAAMNAQVSLFTPVEASNQTNIYKPLNFSVNVFWGVHNSLSGFEMGGLANIIENDAEGVQMCGLYNGVGQTMHGAQFSGLVNSVGSAADGVQVAGLANTAGGGKLVQFSFITNIARQRAYSQVTGLVNVGGHVDYVQFAGLMNVAESCGVQVGLLNFADSANASIGLLSFVKYGYRSLEIAGEEALHANLNFRMGVRPFYNILHLGTNIDFDSWSLGYGIGTSIRTGPRNYLQLEIMTRHINENERWTESLNLLSQFKVLFDARIGKMARVAFGPSFNIATSRLYHPDSNSYGTRLAPSWTFYDRTDLDNNDQYLNIKMWIGFHAGIRLNSREYLKDQLEYMN